GLPDLVNQALLYVGYRFLRHQDSALISASSRVIGISAAISIVAISTVAVSTVAIPTVAVPVSSAVSTGFSFFPAIVVAIPTVSVVAVIIFLIWKCVVCYLWGQVNSSPFPALFSICVRCFIYGADICSIVVSVSTQAEKIMKRMAEE
ncbi:hypothetical protein, partial [[Clostridium] symbiosum]|uniref:hypothetical protein n=1 Tax=Clostridium symbiosum TaxID=1512 RepID=UPI001A9A9D19